MTNNNVTDERIAKILSETQATINEHNRRQVRGSVEVDARLFEAVLIEAQLYRAGSNHLGITTAAKWVDQLRGSYDSEHGRHDTDTGTFEFGSDAQAEYSATLAEIADGIRSLHSNAALQPLTDAERAELDSVKAQLKAAQAHITELEMAPPAPVEPGEEPVPVMPDFPGKAMTQRECYRTGWEAHHAAMLQAGAPVQFGWSKGHFGYHALFNAIGKAVSIQGSALSISVSAFEDAMCAAAPQQQQEQTRKK